MDMPNSQSKMITSKPLCHSMKMYADGTTISESIKSYFILTNQITITMNMQLTQTMQQLKLKGMRQAYESLSETRQVDQLSASELLNLLLQAEYEERNNKKLIALTRAAHFRYQASIEEVTFPVKRNLNKDTFLRLSDCSFIDRNENILITGATGVGKSFLASAIGSMPWMLQQASQYPRSE